MTSNHYVLYLHKAAAFSTLLAERSIYERNSKREHWNIFVVLLAALLWAGYTVAEVQTVMCCKCGSVVVHFC
jgi:hypothetical protein